MSVFVDTSAFLAVLAADDQYHQVARLAWQSLISEEERLICNSYVLVETLALLQRRLGMRAVRVFQSEALPSLIVHWIDEQTHERAISALLIADRRDLSLVDCAAFETMRLHSITRAFTFDSHYSEHGFQRIPL